MKKRILAFALSAVMVFAAAGCGNSENSEITDSSNVSVTDETPDNSETTSGETTNITTTDTTADTKDSTTEKKPDNTKDNTSEKTPDNTKDNTSEKKPETTPEKKPDTTPEKKPADVTTSTTPDKPKPDNKPQNSALKFTEKLMPGWNLGNTLDAVGGEAAWGNGGTDAKIFKAIKKAGFKSVRIPVTYIGQFSSNYTIKKEWIDRVKEIVDLALAEDLYVIINIHHDGSPNVAGKWLDITAKDQNKIKAQFKSMWQQISAKFKSYDERVIFESMNEVMEDGNYGAPSKASYANINALNQLFIDTVRASGGNNKTRYVLLPGYNTNIDQTATNELFKLPKDTVSDKMIVSVHYYDPYEFCLAEDKKIVFRWGNAVKGKRASWGNEDYLEKQFNKLKTAFIDKGIPVIIGEYGAIDKVYSDSRSTIYRAYYCEYFNYTARKIGGIATMYWDNGFNGKNGFALFERKTGKEIYPTIIDGIVKGATKDYKITAPTD